MRCEFGALARDAQLKVMSFVALSVVLCSFGCREQQAEQSSRTPSKAPIVEEKRPIPGGKTIAPSGGPPFPYTIEPWCAAFSPDGKQILVGFGHHMFVAHDRQKPPGWSVQLFDVESGKHLQTLNGHRGDVRFVAFFPDGKTAISSGGGGCLIWDLKKGAEVSRFLLHFDYGALLPDGRRLLCSSNRKLELWDVLQGTRLNKYDEIDNMVRSITVSPDGKHALLGCVPEMINGKGDLTLFRLWDVERGRLLRNFDRGNHHLDAPCAFSEDSKLAVMVRWNRDPTNENAVLWELDSRRETKEFPAFAFEPIAAHLSLKENRIVVAGSRGELLCLDVESGKELWTTKGPALGFFAFWANGKLGLSAGGTQRTQMNLILWDTESGRELRQLQPNFQERPRPPVVNHP
jgi:WD40 repeat protein